MPTLSQYNFLRHQTLRLIALGIINHGIGKLVALVVGRVIFHDGVISQ